MHMQKILFRTFALWLPFAVALTGAIGFAYAATQQNYRQSVNDPQIQMAEDAATTLAAEYVPAQVVPRGTTPIDIRKSLAPWITVYDANGTPLESDAVLDGAPPILPAGLFDTRTWQPLKSFSAPTGSETRVTWQPRTDVRQAVVLVSFAASHGIGYVAVGRSMRTVEERIAHLTETAAAAWGTSVLATFAIIFIMLAFGWL
jgi:hypothetical protein